MVHLFRSVDNSLIESSSFNPKRVAIAMTTSCRAPPMRSVMDSSKESLETASEEFSHSLVCCESLCDRENVILQCGQGSGGNLRCKVVCLAFSQSQQSFAFLKYDFQSPSLGINPVSFKKIQCGIGCNQAVPYTVLTSSHKEQTYGCIGKSRISGHVITMEFSAVLFLTALNKQFDQGGSCQTLPFKNEVVLPFSPIFIIPK